MHEQFQRRDPYSILIGWLETGIPHPKEQLLHMVHLYKRGKQQTKYIDS